MNKQEFRDVLFGDNPQKIDKWNELLKDPVFIPKWNGSLQELRDQAYKGL